MNLTPAERAAMVRDLQELANKYARLELIAGFLGVLAEAKEVNNAPK